MLINAHRIHIKTDAHHFMWLETMEKFHLKEYFIEYSIMSGKMPDI